MRSVRAGAGEESEEMQVAQRAESMGNTEKLLERGNTSRRQEAPSPSLATLLQRPISSAVTAASSSAAAGDAGSLIMAPPAAPEDMAMTVSLVLVSPSTVIWLKEACGRGKARKGN